ncbi:Histone-lysine N-methyltransferase ASHR1 [Neolecta irregularis DAH-3]|uniref:Histone-lysine N-methyltransferase ASHR1 n=1 Tax=Neolecta irregularis (strain DAH-3) TaxID=1198029 RepID=A0A1U7LLP5_NEOID|nr:Histone-lysine N-methyltransferase ASHR1 [Neolecta irregularis DAH-3]|eukprot:OLL23462.1 Histone-lysine N-methyltransferase ASHR1 [Neolecta irregularis DAH-3]
MGLARIAGDSGDHPPHSMFAVKNSSSCNGRGLFASGCILRGSAVFFHRPKCSIPDDNSISSTCYSCLASSICHQQILSVCAGCRLVRYCSSNCQKSDWRYHRYECKSFKNAQRAPTCMVRALVRILAIRRTDESWFAQISVLLSHSHEITHHDAVNVIPQLAALVSGERNITLLQETYCRFLTNSIQVTTFMGDAIGVCFDPLISLINHSCNPNIILNHDGKSIIARSLTDIAPDDEMPYIDITQSTLVRQMDLQRYYFDCQCLGCNSPEDHRDKFYCTNCPRPRDPSSSRCQTCHFDNPALDSLRLVEQKYTKLAESHHSQNTIKLYAALQELYKSGFVSTRQPVPSIHHLLFLTHLNRSEFHSALIHSFIPLLYEIFPRQVTTVRLYTTIKLLLHIAAEEQDANILQFAYSLLCECVKRAQESHGTGTLVTQIQYTIEETRIHLALRKDEEIDFQRYMPVVKDIVSQLLQAIKQEKNTCLLKFSL